MKLSFKLKIIILILVAASICFFAISLINSNSREQSNSNSRDQLITVEQRVLGKSISLATKLEPEKYLSVKAPFDGVLLEKKVSTERSVKKDEVLMRIDNVKITIDIRKSTLELKKLQNKLHELQNWTSSFEVREARNNLLRAKKAYRALQEKMIQTKELYELGIISRISFEEEQAQINEKEAAILAAQNSLKKIQRKGSELALADIKVKIDVEQQKLEKLRQLEMSSTIKAFEDSVIIRNDTRDVKNPDGLSLRVGESVKKDQLFFVLATVKNLVVAAKISEADIHLISHGKIVNLYSDFFPDLNLKGKIIQIANSASIDYDSSSQEPGFDFKVLIDEIPDSYREKLKLGTTLNLEIQVGSAQAEVVIPIGAVQQDENGTYVLVSNGNGSMTRQTVILGEYADTEVEIVSGLEPGDKISMPSFQGGFSSLDDLTSSGDSSSEGVFEPISK